MREHEKRILGLLFGFLVFCSAVLSAIGASGDLIWAKRSDPSYGGDRACGVAVHSTGVYVVGYDSHGGTANRWRIEKRSLATGNIIWMKTSNPSYKADVAYGVAVDGTGVYTVGSDYVVGNSRWRIEKRSLATGSLVWVRTSNPSDLADVAYGVVVDGTGIYIVGYDSARYDSRWRIEKRSLATGNLVWVRTSNPSIETDVATDVAVDATGVYVVGYDYVATNSRWRIEKRSLATGNLIWVRTSNPSSKRDDATGVAVDATGVYVVGLDYSSSTSFSQWRIEKRSLATGSLVWVKTSDPSSHDDMAMDVAADGTSVYIVGDDFATEAEDTQWRIEKRSPVDGGLIWFRTSSSSTATSVAVDGTGVYIAGFLGEGALWGIEKRQL